MNVTREQKDAARRDFDRAVNESLLDEVKSVQTAHDWSFERSFAHVVAQNGTARFTKTPCGSRLAQAAQTVDRQSDRAPVVPKNDTAADANFTDQGGWRNAMKRLAEEAIDSASPKISLVPSSPQRRKLIAKMLEKMLADDSLSMDQALSKVLQADPSLGQTEASTGWFTGLDTGQSRIAATVGITKVGNRNTKRAAKERSKAFAAERKAGRSIVNPPSRRRSKWHGHRRTMATVQEVN